ncbi:MULTISPECIES: DUF3343 domain-containing protein [Sporomusa]|uniref:DUF3343 domain-containing protein n=1 Tax=Sporomusa TaxID=2375 RepID=UPI00166806B8|nr:MULTISPECIES: DUF3343 domain-containing protein [Sporomusa]MCM0759365.1 DUF3343 domain-containing protein [Sporomusa sphaeroides DSM 2875]
MISFDSVHQAIKAETLLSRQGIPVYALPTPREIDISCGQCLLFMAGWQEELIRLFAQTNVRWSKLFSRTAAGSAVIYEKITEYGG